MIEGAPIPHPEEDINSSESEFDAGFFEITHFSESPEGFKVQTRQNLRRRDVAERLPYPSNLALSHEQRAELRKGMANEAVFTLP